MTTEMTAVERLVLTDPGNQRDARTLAEQLNRGGRHLAVVPDPEPSLGRASGDAKVVDAEIGDELPLAIPEALVDVVTAVLDAVARGGTLRITTQPKELTTTLAAAELGISRPTLMKMIMRGEIDAHKVGSHTRLDVVDVLEFKRARAARQHEATLALRDLDLDA